MNIARYGMATLGNFVGMELGVSGWLRVEQERIDEFARATGDLQWIHVDVERARRDSPYGGTIAHGYLTLSLVASSIMELGVVPPDAKAALNYGLDKVRFMAPVKTGARVRTRVVLLSVDEKGEGRTMIKLLCSVEIEGEDKPALIAEVRTMLLS